MGVLGDLVVRIRGDNKQFDSSIDKSKQKTAAFTKFLMSGAGIAGAILVFRKLIKVAGDLVKAYGIQEKAEAKLRSAIISTGKEGLISAENLFKYAAELQDVTTFGDEATISAMALLQQLGNLDEQGIRALMPGIQDMSIALGVSLETAASLVGKTLGSTTNALTRYGIVVDATAPKGQKLQEITTGLTEKFGGLSEALGTTATAALEQYKNAVGDLREAQGKAIAEGIEPFVRGITKIVKEMAAAKLEAIAVKHAYEDLKSLGEGQVLAEEQQLLILQDQVNFLGQVAVSYEMLDEAANAAYEAALDRLRAYKDALIAEKYWNDQATRAADDRAATEAANATALREWLEKVNGEYLKTAESKKEILDAEIAYYEYWLPRSEAQKEHIAAILKMLYKQRDATEDVAEEIKLLNVELADWIANQTEIVAGLPTLTRAQLGLNSAMNAFIDSLYAREGAYEGITENLTDERIQQINDEVQAVMDGINLEQEAWAAYYEDQRRIREEENEQRIQDEEKVAREISRIRRALGSTIASVTNSLSQISDNYYKGLLQNEELTDEQRKEILRDQAQAAKRFNLFQAVINTARAIIEALPNVPLSIFSGIVGAAQIAAIASTPIPKLAEGGVVPALLHPNEAILPLDNEEAMSRIANAIANVPAPSVNVGGNLFHISVNLGNKVLYDDIARATKDRRILIDAGAVV